MRTKVVCKMATSCLVQRSRCGHVNFQFGDLPAKQQGGKKAVLPAEGWVGLCASRTGSTVRLDTASLGCVVAFPGLGLCYWYHIDLTLSPMHNMPFFYFRLIHLRMYITL